MAEVETYVDVALMFALLIGIALLGLALILPRLALG